MVLSEEEKSRIERDLERDIYEAAVKYFTSLELNEAINGNGHHMAQKVAASTVEFLRGRWRETS